MLIVSGVIIALLCVIVLQLNSIIKLLLSAKKYQGIVISCISDVEKAIKDADAVNEKALNSVECKLDNIETNTSNTASAFTKSHDYD